MEIGFRGNIEAIERFILQNAQLTPADMHRFYKGQGNPSSEHHLIGFIEADDKSAYKYTDGVKETWFILMGDKLKEVTKDEALLHLAPKK